MSTVYPSTFHIWYHLREHQQKLLSHLEDLVVKEVGDLRESVKKGKIMANFFSPYNQVFQKLFKKIGTDIKADKK